VRAPGIPPLPRHPRRGTRDDEVPAAYVRLPTSGRLPSPTPLPRQARPGRGSPLRRGETRLSCRICRWVAGPTRGVPASARPARQGVAGVGNHCSSRPEPSRTRPSRDARRRTAVEESHQRCRSPRWPGRTARGDAGSGPAWPDRHNRSRNLPLVRGCRLGGQDARDHPTDVRRARGSSTGRPQPRPPQPPESLRVLRAELPPADIRRRGPGHRPRMTHADIRPARCGREVGEAVSRS
jgi:hypothetical protein